MKKVIAIDKEHLQSLIEESIKLHGNNCDLNHIDVSNVRDMHLMFLDSIFNGDISQWDVSKTVNINYIFPNSIYEKPWWGIDSNELRNEVIEKYKLRKEIEETLAVKENIHNKREGTKI